IIHQVTRPLLSSSDQPVISSVLAIITACWLPLLGRSHISIVWLLGLDNCAPSSTSLVPSNCKAKLPLLLGVAVAPAVGVGAAVTVGVAVRVAVAVALFAVDVAVGVAVTVGVAVGIAVI